MAEDQGPVPSDAAVDRLQHALHDRSSLYAMELDIDLDDIERAMATGREDLAASVLHDHLERLEQFQSELHRLIADASIEREAEGVVVAALPAGLSVCSATPPPAAAPARSAAPTPTTPPSLVPGSRPNQPARSRGGRRGLVAAGSLLAAALLSLSSPGSWWVNGADPLDAAEVASRQAVVAAHAAAAGSSEELARLTVLTFDLHSAIVDLDGAELDDPQLRVRLTGLLSDQQAALAPLAIRLPAAALMLQDLQALASRLDLAMGPVPRRAAASGSTSDGMPSTAAGSTAGPETMATASSTPAVGGASPTSTTSATAGPPADGVVGDRSPAPADGAGPPESPAADPDAADPAGATPDSAGPDSAAGGREFDELLHPSGEADGSSRDGSPLP